MFGAVYAADGSALDALVEVAREFSPRIAIEDAVRGEAREVTLDLSGLARMFGDGRTIAGEMRRTAADRGLRVRVAIAPTRTAARLLAHARPGLTVIEAGEEASAVGTLSIDLLAVVMRGLARPTTSGRPTTHDPRITTSARPPTPDPRITALRRWGLRTLGDLARLPAGDVAARLGQGGAEWQRLARGEDLSPLVPAMPDELFEQALDLEWPIEGLEPLSFVLARLMEPLSLQLERHDRGVAVLHVRLHLVTRELHERSLQLPAPTRDARTLRTLALLDLESHPPAAAIDRVVVAVDPTSGRVLQYSLLTRPLPTPEQVSTLLARLSALMGAGRCGSPAEVDSWQPGAFAMTPFAPVDMSHDRCPPHRPSQRPVPLEGAPMVAVRRFRFPVPARVRVEGGTPVRIITDRRGLSGGRVEACAGPWRTSGAWWEAAGRAGRAGEAVVPAQARGAKVGEWDRDEWDVTLADGATYRVFRERSVDAWFMDGIVD